MRSRTEKPSSAKTTKAQLKAKLRSAIEPLEARTLLSTYTVNTLSDAAAPGPGNLTLRQAVTNANSHVGADTIAFSATVFAPASLHTITLTRGQLLLADKSGATTIAGPGAAVLAISGGGASRVFKVAAGVSATISGLAVINGQAPVDSIGTAQGGGIFNAGTLTLSAVNVSQNSAEGAPPGNSIGKPYSYAYGGGIYSAGQLQLQNSTVSGNSAVGGSGVDTSHPVYPAQEPAGGWAFGGGIWCGAALTISASTVSNNQAIGGYSGFWQFDDGPDNGGSASGGGIACSALTLTNSTVAGNTAEGRSLPSGSGNHNGRGGSGSGGGISASGIVTISNSTLSGNMAIGADFRGDDRAYAGGASGGALAGGASTTIQSSTITQNQAIGGDNTAYGHGGDANGGGVYSAGPLAIIASTISANTAKPGENEDAVPSVGAGGGIFTYSTLTLTQCTLTGNSVNHKSISSSSDRIHSSSGGGGAFVTGDANIVQCTVSSNSVLGNNSQAVPALGGGLNVQGSLTLSLSTVSGNSAAGTDGTLGQGGGIWCGGSLIATSSTIADNSASGGNRPLVPSPYSPYPCGGGGALVAGAATITQCTVSGNTVTASANYPGPSLGGGLDIEGSLTLSFSTVSGNSASGVEDTYGKGGGIWCGGSSLIITNSTIANNSATVSPLYGFTNSGSIGGGIAASGSVSLYDSTIVGNAATAPLGTTASGGGLSVTSPALLDNSIVSANKANGAFNDIFGPVRKTSANNLIGVGGSLTNGVNGNKIGVTNPKLAALGKYGGPTQTMPPLIGSPAIDAGSNSLIPAGITADQRGFPRIVGGKVDIGAVEFSKIVISGAVYNDINGDGVRQAGEPGMANVQVYVDLTNAGIFVAGDPVATTGALGNYVLTFAPLTVKGSLIIREVRPPTMRRTQPAGIYPLGFYTISSTAGAVSNINFGNSLTSLVTGTVYKDTNANGKLDSGEAGLFGWNVHASYVVNNVHIIKTILTDTKGNYSFILPPGACTITESVQPGFTRTKPGAGGYTLTLAPGATITGENFGNA